MKAQTLAPKAQTFPQKAHNSNKSLRATTNSPPPPHNIPDMLLIPGRHAPPVACNLAQEISFGCWFGVFRFGFRRLGFIDKGQGFGLRVVDGLALFAGFCGVGCPGFLGDGDLRCWGVDDCGVCGIRLGSCRVSGFGETLNPKPYNEP